MRSSVPPWGEALTHSGLAAASPWWSRVTLYTCVSPIYHHVRFVLDSCTSIDEAWVIFWLCFLSEFFPHKKRFFSTWKTAKSTSTGWFKRIAPNVFRIQCSRRSLGMAIDPEIWHASVLRAPTQPLANIIQAKRVSNWYIPKKKSARVHACTCARVFD